MRYYAFIMYVLMVFAVLGAGGGALSPVSVAAAQEQVQEQAQNVEQVFAQSGAADQVFFASIPDLPVQPNLQEITDQSVMFDKPEGRIIESVALIVRGSRGEITAYYEDSLPQLGWQKIAENEYVRGGEVLRLGFEVIEDQEFLRVMVRPN